MNQTGVNLQAARGARQAETRAAAGGQQGAGADLGFKALLARNLDRSLEAPANPVNFSKHAAIRLSDRNISISNEQMERVGDGLRRAGEKGIRDSLVLVDDLALVVNVKSRTVITALQSAPESVFSNIDGAVIV